MKLHDLLKYELKKSGLSKNEIIRRTGIEKSTCYQYFSGKRLPTDLHFSKLMEAMQVGKGDYRLLWEEFQRTRYGEDILRRTELMHRLLQTVSAAEAEQNRQKKITFSLIPGKDTSSGIISGREEILDRLLSCLLKSAGGGRELDLFLPVENYFITRICDMIRQLSVRGLVIHHLTSFSFHKKDTGSTITEWFSQALALLLNSEISYRLFYYYDDSNPENALGIMYPYYIITDDSLILISSDLSSGTEIRNEDVRKAWRAGYHRALNTSHSIIKDTGSLAWQPGSCLYMINPLPSLMQSALSDPDRERNGPEGTLTAEHPESPEGSPAVTMLLFPSLLPQYTVREAKSAAWSLQTGRQGTGSGKTSFTEGSPFI